MIQNITEIKSIDDAVDLFKKEVCLDLDERKFYFSFIKGRALNSIIILEDL